MSTYEAVHLALESNLVLLGVISIVITLYVTKQKK